MWAPCVPPPPHTPPPPPKLPLTMYICAVAAFVSIMLRGGLGGRMAGGMRPTITRPPGMGWLWSPCGNSSSSSRGKQQQKGTQSPSLQDCECRRCHKSAAPPTPAAALTAADGLMTLLHVTGYLICTHYQHCVSGCLWHPCPSCHQHIQKCHVFDPAAAGT